MNALIDSFHMLLVKQLNKNLKRTNKLVENKRQIIFFNYFRDEKPFTKAVWDKVTPTFIKEKEINLFYTNLEKNDKKNSNYMHLVWEGKCTYIYSIYV